MKEIKNFNKIMEAYDSELNKQGIKDSEKQLILELLYLFLSEKSLISKISHRNEKNK